MNYIESGSDKWETSKEMDYRNEFKLVLEILIESYYGF